MRNGALASESATPFCASPNTAYWLVLGATGSGSFGWAYAPGNAQTGPGSLGGYSYSTNAGALPSLRGLPFAKRCAGQMSREDELPSHCRGDTPSFCANTRDKADGVA